MNFLAHLVLASQTPEGLVGSLAPDMIRGPLPSDLHEDVAASAQEHYLVDRFTDRHQAFSQTRERLAAVVDPRLSGVLADVLYDHLLARDWMGWRDGPLSRYLAVTEPTLIEALPRVPIRMQMIVRKMIDERWLASYATVHGIRLRLKTMSQRLTHRLDRPMSLMISENDLADLDAGLTQDFGKFWPELVAHVDQSRAERYDRLAS